MSKFNNIETSNKMDNVISDAIKQGRKIKAKNRKKQRALTEFSKSIKLKCCYCELSGKCDRQAYKEDSEKRGFKTYCNITPNIKKSKKKKKQIVNNL